MNVLAIEQKFQTEATLGEVLELCKEDFERIDYFAQSVLKSSMTDNPEEVIKALNEITGIYLSLKPVVAIAETEKSNREIRQYNVLRIELENAGGKFTSASVEKQASDFVANYRRIRNIVTAYLESAEKAISTLQSILKYLTTERNITPRD
jgi:hypothetical protein